MEALTFEQACEVLGKNPNNLPVLDGATPAEQEQLEAFYKLRVIAKAMNQQDGFVSRPERRGYTALLSYNSRHNKWNLFYNASNSSTSNSFLGALFWLSSHSRLVAFVEKHGNLVNALHKY